MDTTTIYFMTKCYKDGRKGGGNSCTEDEAMAHVKKLLNKATTTVSSGDASKECRSCKHGSIVPGSSHHLQCADPDPFMKGDDHGIKNGWFFYPLNFDPIWKTKECINHEKKA